MSDYRPVAEVLGGLEFEALRDGYIPMEATVLIKAMDPEGHNRWIVLHTDGLPPAEQVGALTILLERAKDDWRAMWDCGCDEDDD